MARTVRPGGVVLFGSGETAGVGREALGWLRETGREIGSIAVLETPAGFELNAADVARRWTDFLGRQAEAQGAVVTQLPLRRRGTADDPDRADLARPILAADVTALGAGSPTYAARQLRGTAAWRFVTAAHLRGASLLLASASAIAAGSAALPVYEIYKAGADLGWAEGLGLFEPFGLTLAVVPHWDNTEGGDVDTSRCFMGAGRFDALRALLPDGTTVVGVAEHTALAIDAVAGTARVLGQRDVTLVAAGTIRSFEAGATFPLAELGPFRLPEASIVPADLVRAIREARAEREPDPSDDVLALVDAREDARRAADWGLADRLRDDVARQGWRIDDTPEGPRLVAEADAGSVEAAPR